MQFYLLGSNRSPSPSAVSPKRTAESGRKTHEGDTNIRLFGHFVLFPEEALSRGPYHADRLFVPGRIVFDVFFLVRGPDLPSLWHARARAPDPMTYHHTTTTTASRISEAILRNFARSTLAYILARYLPFRPLPGLVDAVST